MEQLPEGTVTILFTDAVGSTALAATVGDRAARERMREREEHAREQVHRHRGREVKGTGDGMMAVFMSARRAVECAIDIQRSVERLNLARPDEALTLRIGLNSGEAFPERGDLYGSMVNAAARIQSVAGPGEVWVSEIVRLLLGPGSRFEFTDRGQFSLKGFDTPLRLYEVAWREPAGVIRTGLSPLVGREQERAAMRGWLAEVESGSGVLALLGGEAGVGKSRLAQEALSEAEARGFLTLTGHCYETEGTPPYNPFAEIIEMLARVLDPQALQQVLGDDAPHAAKLAPRLQPLLSDMPPAPERPPAVERRVLLDAIRSIVERLAARRPLVLLLEDLHWADASTAVLLQHLAPRVRKMPVLVLGTYRETEVFAARPLTSALPELLRQPRVVDVRVTRLPRAAVANMLRAYGGHDAPARLVELVIRETEGNPFFIEQVLKHLTEAGRMFDAAGRWRTDVDVGEDEVPRGVRHVIGRRLDRVSADCRRTLTRAAIIGRAFSYELLRELAEARDEETLLAAMDEAEATQLVMPEIVGGETRLSFAHELIRQTLLAELSLPRRQLLHARVADAIESAAGANVERHASDLAYHLYQAGRNADAQRTVRYLAMAGKQALGAAAFEDATRRFDAALELVGEDAPVRAELLYQRGVAQFAIGRWDRAEPDWEAALEAAERSDGEPELGGRIAFDYGMQVAYARRPADSYAILRRGLAVLHDRPSRVHARLLAFFAMTGSDAGIDDYNAAATRFDEAARMAESIGDRAALGLVSSHRAHFHWRHKLMADCAAEYQRACELLEATGELYALAQARTWRALALIALGRFAEAAAMTDGLDAYCERVGDFGSVFAARRARAFMDVTMTGDFARWEAFARADLAFLEAVGSGWTANSHSYVALGQFWSGRWDEALPHAHRALELALDDSWAGTDETALLLLLAYRHEHDAVRSLIAERRRYLPVAGVINRAGAWELLPAVVEALAVIGDHADAAALYPVALDAAGRGVPIHYGVKSLPATTAGIAAACARQWSAAEEHFRVAVRQADELPNRIEQPEARRWWAAMLLARDAAEDRARARALLAEAVRLYDEIGMARHSELATQLLAAAEA